VGTWEGGSVVVDLPLRGTVTVGRGAEADVRLDHTSVSRRHARLVLGETMTVEDLGSSNGTKVRGRTLPTNGGATIEPGDLVELGSTLMVVHRRGGAAEPPRALPAAPAAARPGRHRAEP
jgi:pSer/pThr/pTyr-binding forkhead associated (FHA) protein